MAGSRARTTCVSWRSTPLAGLSNGAFSHLIGCDRNLIPLQQKIQDSITQPRTRHSAGAHAAHDRARFHHRHLGTRQRQRQPLATLRIIDTLSTSALPSIVPLPPLTLVQQYMADISVEHKRCGTVTMPALSWPPYWTTQSGRLPKQGPVIPLRGVYTGSCRLYLRVARA